MSMIPYLQFISKPKLTFEHNSDYNTRQIHEHRELAILVLNFKVHHHNSHIELYAEDDIISLHILTSGKIALKETVYQK